MDIRALTCKNCGATLEVDEAAREANCPYCNTSFTIKSEEEKGYEYEKGRMRAQEERRQKAINDMQKNIGRVTEDQRNAVKIIATIFIAMTGISIFVSVMFFFIMFIASFSAMSSL